MLKSQREASIVEGKLSGNVVIAVASVKSGDSSSSDIGGSFLVEFSELGRSEQFLMKVFAFNFVLVA